MFNLAGLLGGNAIDGFIKGISGILDKAFPSPEERAKAEAILEAIRQHPDDLQQELLKLQAQTNIEEAKNPASDKSWRTWVGRVLAISLGLYFIPQFLMAAILWTKICWATSKFVPYPVDAFVLMQLLAGMLGLGGIKAYEKVNMSKPSLPQPFR